MSSNTLDQLKTTLQLNEARHQGEEILKGRELDDFRSIAKEFDEERSNTDQLYRDEYKVRINTAYQEALREAGSKKMALRPKWLGADKFSTNALMRQAQMKVRHDHNQDLARLDRQELEKTSGFLEKCAQRKEYVEAFKQVSDRRQMQSRRLQPDRRHTPTMSDQ
jgi:hypothetical protein